jgi:adenylosuccinate synthase
MKVLLIGLGYGDEGKGTIVDTLVRRLSSGIVVRFNGGPQSAHHVVTDRGVVHCFSQFGSGTLVFGVRTYLSRFMLVDPLAIDKEKEALKRIGVRDALERLFIHHQCTLVTPYHKLIGRMRELARGKQKYGSCGLGVGEAAMDRLNPNQPSLILDDLKAPQSFKTKLAFLWYTKVDQGEQLVDEYPENVELRNTLADLKRGERLDHLCEYYISFLRALPNHLIEGGDWVGIPLGEEPPIFEGAQGVLLDRERGFCPYVTKTRTTFHNAFELGRSLKDSERVLRIGVLRSYAVRHGPGPFVSEDKSLQKLFPEVHNTTNPWQGHFRIGWLDLVATRYAIAVTGGVDALAITHVDRLSYLSHVKVCKAYEYHGAWDESWNELFEWEQYQEAIVIRSLRVLPLISRAQQETLTTVLERCQPIYHDFVSCQSSQAVSQGRINSPSIIKYLHFLESREGLDVQIALVSVGLTAQDKIIWKPNILPKSSAYS